MYYVGVGTSSAKWRRAAYVFYIAPFEGARPLARDKNAAPSFSRRRPLWQKHARAARSYYCAAAFDHRCRLSSQPLRYGRARVFARPAWVKGAATSAGLPSTPRSQPAKAAGGAIPTRPNEAACINIRRALRGRPLRRQGRMRAREAS